MAGKRKLWEETASNIRDRLSLSLGWYPYPLLISFGLVLILTGHVLSGINARLGNPSEVMEFDAPYQKDGAVWLSVTPIDADIVVSTGDRRIFRWPQNLTNLEGAQELVRYLSQRVNEEILSATLSKTALRSQATVVIAADKDLKYVHLKPVIEALAAARITNYAFETRIPVIRDEDDRSAGISTLGERF